MVAKTHILPPAPGGVIPALLRRDRVLVIGGVVALSAVCWAYTLDMAFDMSAMPRMDSFSPAYLGWAFVMWTVMMVAMMLPSALPMTMAYARYSRMGNGRTGNGGAGQGLGAALAIGSFVGGYLLMWAAFSLAATMAQALLIQGTVLSPMMMTIMPKGVAGAVLIVAGIYQLTPAKEACLRQCRTTFGFMATEWREGARGALIMGLRHGMYCVGCCWALMAVLFVTGVMNILWVALLTLFVIVEKAAPLGGWAARAGGVAMIGAGLAMIAL